MGRCFVKGEFVELARGAVAPEFRWIDLAVEPGPPKHLVQGAPMLVPHRLLDAVGAEALDLAADEQARLIDRIAERIARVAEHHEVAALGHQSAHIPNPTLP